jgi:hypothetical protein
MRESRTYGSVRGARGNSRPYREADLLLRCMSLQLPPSRPCLPHGGHGSNWSNSEVLRDAYCGELKPLYNYMDDLPALGGESPPFLHRKHLTRIANKMSSIDLGRGCP